MKVQLQKPLVLRDPDTTNWHLLQGDSDVRVEVRHWAESLVLPTASWDAFLGGRPTAGSFGVG